MTQQLFLLALRDNSDVLLGNTAEGKVMQVMSRPSCTYLCGRLCVRQEVGELLKEILVGPEQHGNLAAWQEAVLRHNHLHASAEDCKVVPFQQFRCTGIRFSMHTSS